MLSSDLSENVAHPKIATLRDFVVVCSQRNLLNDNNLKMYNMNDNHDKKDRMILDCVCLHCIHAGSISEVTRCH